jgi:thimet oligopeptidase
MFSKFDQSDLLNPAIATRYRDTVIGQGGSAPAAKLVHNFLGRDYDFRSFDNWLAGESQQSPKGGKGAGGASAPR